MFGEVLHHTNGIANHNNGGMKTFPAMTKENFHKLKTSEQEPVKLMLFIDNAAVKNPPNKSNQHLCHPSIALCHPQMAQCYRS